MFRVLSVFLIASISLSAPAPKGKDGVLYFPTKVGDTLVYEVKVGDTSNELTEVVTTVEPKGAGLLVSVSRRVGKEDTPKEKVEVSPAGLSRHSIAKRDLASTQRMLSLSAGDSWTVEETTAKNARKSTYTVGKVEEVQVPAGKYQAIPVERTSNVGAKDATVTSWYAPGVGLVKSVAHVGGTSQTVTITLKSFTPGK